MKLTGRDAAAYFRRPDPEKAGLLIYGGDTMRVAARRQEVISALIGPEGETEMRLARISGADLRKDPAQLLDAVKAQGFFPGQRVAFVDEATDGLAKTIGTALEEWRPGDAQIIVTAGQLPARSALRKLFEKAPAAYAVGIYDDPPDRAEIERMVDEAGAGPLDRDASAALASLGRELGPGDLRQVIEKLALYRHGAQGEASAADVEACAPRSTEADLDDILAIVAGGRTDEIGPVLRNLYAQGVEPVRLCIGATLHFRTLHKVAADPEGPGAGIGRLRPPVFGPRRDRIFNQAQAWGGPRLERALSELTDTDLQLRSATRAPGRALVERAFVRLSMIGRSR